MLAWLSGMRCRLAYSPADATATHYLLLQSVQIGFNFPGFTFLVTAHPGTHNHFTALLKFVRDHPGEQVPER